MKISIAQIEPIKGDIEKNLSKHLKFIEAASSGRSDLIMFPELSLTGYEPQFDNQTEGILVYDTLSKSVDTIRTIV